MTDVAALAQAIVAGDRRMLARAITLVESRRPDDARATQELLEQLPIREDGVRIGITGVPGVGKSTFIDALGSEFTARGSHVAVLAIDPSSTVSGGSILGDKTRMERLSRDPQAFVRPTPGGLHPGGVARRTHETIVLCEAAGFDVVLVETIGIGQSEVAVSDLVDSLVLLLLTGAGDDLQGMKRGIMELADLFVVHKADGDNALVAKRTAVDYETAISFLPRRHPEWRPTVSTCSSLEGIGVDTVRDHVLAHRATLGAEGLRALRSGQALVAFEAMVRDDVMRSFLARDNVADAIADLRDRVAANEMLPSAAARALAEL